MKSKKNLFAAVLSLLLIFTFVPAGTAFAAEAELYPFEVRMLSDYGIDVWLDGKLYQPTDSTTYYIPAGTIVKIEWEGCYLLAASNLSDCDWWGSGGGPNDWSGIEGFTMPARSVYYSFSHR